jgi:hypothetical protein
MVDEFDSAVRRPRGNITRGRQEMRSLPHSTGPQCIGPIVTVAYRY